jgi:hypothetical protein
MSDEAVFDNRVVARNIKAGVISQEDHDKYLASLEDCADLGTETETQMVFKIGTDEAEDDASPRDDA